ncbi:MAG: (deoxy)nucleoside triphosphate pyrophosphohydrolase [Spirochaetales bacterium]|nr:(deoxy)nucleoside triphosphate pyrophosphohydrolase [Spirochaetales bacterium]
MKRKSVCGVACQDEKYLVAQRKPGGSQGGKWEFPGGKLEDGEGPEEALKREFEEELSVAIDVLACLGSTIFQNGENQYLLEAWRINLRSRDFILTEHQTVLWVDLPTLLTMDLSGSDRDIVNLLSKNP